MQQKIPLTKIFIIISIYDPIESLERSLMIPSCNPAKNVTDKKIIPDLTVREKEILHLIFNGMNNKEIAARLFLSIKTVENHRNNILKKTKSKSMISLLNSLYSKGFISGGL
ncbi:MAG: LuxR C-terminal-related transcriptional regulator [Bacteroidia bacterium]